MFGIYSFLVFSIKNLTVNQVLQHDGSYWLITRRQKTGNSVDLPLLDIPLETLSKVLGHNSIKMTQIYAKVTNKKVSNEMNALVKKICFVF